MDRWDLVKTTKQGRVVVVLRGVSGAGKSTLAGLLTATALGTTRVVSADRFFTRPDGTYAFDPAQLGEAHAACLLEFADAVLHPTDDPHQLIVVDNTSTTVAEVAPYMALALAAGWTALVVTLEGDWQEAALRNRHGVELSTAFAQHERLQASECDLPLFWRRHTLRGDA